MAVSLAHKFIPPTVSTGLNDGTGNSTQDVSMWPPVDLFSVDLLKVISPRYDAICPTDAACAGNFGYKVLALTNPPALQAELPNGTPGGSISCPEQCPGPINSRLGIYFTSACIGFRTGSTCLDQQVCLGHTLGFLRRIDHLRMCVCSQYAAECAYGLGDGCRPCPSGALCPGGWRMRSQQGMGSILAGVCMCS